MHLQPGTQQKQLGGRGRGVSRQLRLRIRLALPPQGVAPRSLGSSLLPRRLGGTARCRQLGLETRDRHVWGVGGWGGGKGGGTGRRMRGSGGAVQLVPTCTAKAASTVIRVGEAAPPSEMTAKPWDERPPPPACPHPPAGGLRPSPRPPAQSPTYLQLRCTARGRVRDRLYLRAQRLDLGSDEARVAQVGQVGLLALLYGRGKRMLGKGERGKGRWRWRWRGRERCKRKGGDPESVFLAEGI